MIFSCDIYWRLIQWFPWCVRQIANLVVVSVSIVIDEWNAFIHCFALLRLLPNRLPFLWDIGWNIRFFPDRTVSAERLVYKFLYWETNIYFRKYKTPNHQTWMFLASSCCCICPRHRCQVLSREWRCSWSSADRRCSNYIWVIDKFIAR